MIIFSDVKTVFSKTSNCFVKNSFLPVTGLCDVTSHVSVMMMSDLWFET